ncbi:uncharacterized protein I206_100578 [Kwoniella pini CBS 10737]|uniref:Metallo-beta-lactamase domain-containing protein n=1 Tax=Kwoniella pini CBS 10737 TaxID=1296096 RepID=A0AAJ8KY86_9TREE
MSDAYTLDDPRIKPVPLQQYPWSPLPQAKSKDRIVKVSIIPTATLSAPVKVFSAFAKGDEKEDSPCWSFLIEKGDDAILWDMGLRQDPQNAPKKIVDGPLKEFVPHTGPGPIARLRKHGYDLGKLGLVVFSHQHFDRPDSLESMQPGFPEDVNSAWPSDWLKNYHFVELPDENDKGVWTGEIAELSPKDQSDHRRRWEKIGCFDRGVDWFGDGSLWFLDAPGHCPGHIMALCRVSAQPDTYVLLGGDASHHQALYLPVPEDGVDLRSPIPVIDGKPQLAIDPKLATYTIGQMTRMSAEDNVMVILAHEGQVEGIVDLYPGDLSGWMSKGWKEAKERGVEEDATARQNQK